MKATSAKDTEKEHRKSEAQETVEPSNLRFDAQVPPEGGVAEVLRVGHVHVIRPGDAQKVHGPLLAVAFHGLPSDPRDAGVPANQPFAISSLPWVAAIQCLCPHGQGMTRTQPTSLYLSLRLIGEGEPHVEDVLSNSDISWSREGAAPVRELEDVLEVVGVTDAHAARVEAELAAVAELVHKHGLRLRLRPLRDVVRHPSQEVSVGHELLVRLS